MNLNQKLNQMSEQVSDANRKFNEELQNITQELSNADQKLILQNSEIDNLKTIREELIKQQTQSGNETAQRNAQLEEEIFKLKIENENLTQDLTNQQN